MPGNFGVLTTNFSLGNDGRLGFFFKEIEITPPGASGYFRFNADDTPAMGFSPEADVRAVVEGQFLSMRLHASNIGNHQRSWPSQCVSHSPVPSLCRDETVFKYPRYWWRFIERAYLQSNR